jgi:hypothetical protein
VAIIELRNWRTPLANLPITTKPFEKCVNTPGFWVILEARSASTEESNANGDFTELCLITTAFLPYYILIIAANIFGPVSSVFAQTQHFIICLI